MASWWNSARDSLSALAEKANDMDLGGAMSTLKKDLGEFASTIKVRKSDTHVKRVPVPTPKSVHFPYFQVTPPSPSRAPLRRLSSRVSCACHTPNLFLPPPSLTHTSLPLTKGRLG